MVVEMLSINGTMVPHTVVPIIGDGACLFRAIAYILYDTQVMAREMREEIVDHVVEHWEEFSILSHDRFGNNYNTAAHYYAEMSQLYTYGGLCELVAAGQIFPCIFEVYYNGTLYEKFGREENPVHRLRFSTPHDLSNGHFDVYLPLDMSIPVSTLQIASSSTSSKTTEKEKSRRAVEMLCINGTMVPHTVVPIIGDGACLFRAIAYILYDTQVMAREMREEIVDHVVEHWEEFSILSHDRFGNNYKTAADYYAEMSQLYTYGGLCELVAAGQIFPCIFEVYHNGILYKKFGQEENPVHRLRFRTSHDLSNGHFDVYLPLDVSNPVSTPQIATPSISSKTTEKEKRRRARFTDATRKKQFQNAYNKYKESNLDIHRNNLSVTSVPSGMMYDAEIAYETDKTVVLGAMNHKCVHCFAFKWKEEASGMCCASGKVKLPAFEPLPEPLYSLVMDLHPEHAHFMDGIRKYNGCFQMTSFGATKIIEDGYMPTFKVQGQVYHLVGSLLPLPQQEPKFLQIYFIGEDEREASLRCNNFPYVKQNLVKQLQAMLHDQNAYIRDLKTTLQKVPEGCDKFEVVIHADRKPTNAHMGRFNAPTTNEVALVIVGQQFEKRDIVLQGHDNKLRRISELNRSYDSLQYPLIFCYGEDGYSVDIHQYDPKTKKSLQKTVSALNFYSYRIMVRQVDENRLLYFRALFSQYLVDMYAKIETERLNYIRNNQSQLRADSYLHLKDAIGRQDTDIAQLGQMVVLPSSFTGSPRYMQEKTQDAMTYVRHYGRPDLFITFTCNPRWKDITDILLPGQKSHDRHDIIARVFHLKVKKMMALLTKSNLFGKVRCFIYSVEWQKRGLPHIHILLWLEQRINPDAIDNVICAEIPDPEQDPLLYDIVKANMIHGPCGSLNYKSSCMKNRSCSKRYPRPLIKNTQTGDDGYPQYRRRSPADGGHTIKINDIELDNRWVVPYNPVLSRTFSAHINVEYCNSVKSIKYICKYVTKGSDQAAFTLENEKDEVKLYENGRYLSSSEAVWRTLSFPIHERFPPVTHLAVHLENGQRVYFSSNNNLLEKINSPPQTTLLAFFDLCKTDEFAKTLLYPEVPAYFVWTNKKFSRRKRGKAVEGWPEVKKEHALGRVYTVHPNNTECYHLRLLLHVVRGPTSFEDLKTVNSILHPSFQSACKALGLLEDDKHWDTALEEAALCDSPSKMRELFIIMLVFCQLSEPLSLWEKYKDSLSDDIKRHLERELQDSAQLLIDEVFNKCLILIEDAVLEQTGQNLAQFGLPQPKRSSAALDNREYLREIRYDPCTLREVVTHNEELLTDEQFYVYQRILGSIEKGTGQIFFLDAPGGTGKTFLINLLLAKVRSTRGIALAVASSGIAATLLEGGKTAHAAFKLPLNLIHVENPLCNILKQSNTAQVLRDCKLIVWDESTMAHKGGFEALNRTLKDIRGNDDMMGGVTVLLAGDFRQTLPVVPRGTRADEVKACIKASYLWPSIEKLHLKKNMRVHLNSDVCAGQFSDLLLKIGNGEYPETEGKITIPSDLASVVSTVDELIARIYPDVHNLQTKSIEWLCERAILTPKNDQASVINDNLLKSFEGAEYQFKSVDTVIHSDDAINYPVEFLNALNPPGLPSHRLILKVGAPVMLLRNLNPPKLCNGTRLRVEALHKNVVEAIVCTGCARGESVYIPRIPLIPSEYPFEFKRLQFPLKVCFAMTINKSQGQSLKTAGIDLRGDCFSHGQFYVACSRVSSPSSLVVLAPEGRTSNIVYKEMSAIDPDCGVNALVNYTLGDGLARPQFSVKPDSGELCVSAPLDHETNSDFEFPVIATDRGGLSTTAMVKIQLLDINDNVPVFTVRDYNVSLKEGRISSNEPIVAVSASDNDSGRFGTVTYRIINGNDNDIFRIDRSTGEIFVTKPSLIQASGKFDLEVSATDGGGLAAPQGAMVHVNVIPAGVGSALFDKPRYNFRVREDVRSGTIVGSLKATAGGKQLVRYSIVSGDADRRFTIEPHTGAIRTSGKLDRETTSSYLLNIRAATSNSANYDQTQVQITLEDVNDNTPEFGSSSVRVSVAESAAIGSVVYAARATDEDEGKNGQITYNLVSATGPVNTFAVNPQHGLVTLLRSLDYENLVRHTLIISAKDGGNPQLSANLTLAVDVQDVNDNAPVFEHDTYSANVLESDAVKTKILEIQAIDKDTGNNARITYRVVSENNTNEEHFKVQPATGWVYLAKQLDRETIAKHKMTIIATDNGIPPLSATASLIVNVVDANDNDPVFSQTAYDFLVEENQEVGAYVGKISATDADLGDNAFVKYSLFPSNTSFIVNPTTGIITTKEILDREYKNSYSLFAEARDQGSLPRSSRVPVSIKITDVNDNAPEIIDPREDVVSVREEQQPGAEVARVKAIDRDNGVNATVVYSILNERDMDGFGVFVIDSNTGVIKTSTVLDHEERSIYRLTVAATDGGHPPRQTVRQLKVEVLDLNDNRPTFTSSSLSFKVKEDAKVGHIVGTVACCDSDLHENSINGEERQISYLLMPLTSDHSPGTFEIDRRTGYLVVARQLDREIQDEYRLEVRALDTSATNNPQSSAVTVRIEIVDVNDNAPQWPEDPIKIEVSEVTPVGMTIYNFTASDTDAGSNGELNFSIMSSLPLNKNAFTLDPLTGSLTLTSPLDYELLKEYWLVIEASDLAANITERMITSATVHVAVIDANDNTPTFVSANKVSVTLNTLSGTLYQALAVDTDSGDNGRISYYIAGGNDQAYFSIEHDTGKLTLTKKYSSDIARVKPGQYKLNLTASDHGTPFPRQSHMTLLLNLQESTNVPPRFSDSYYRANISEDIRPNSFVTRLSAKSSRGNTGNLRFMIPSSAAGDKFAIDERLGTVTVKTKIDREEADHYIFPVYVTDSSTFQSTTNFDVTTVLISVLDVNDNPPYFKPGSCYTLTVPENNNAEIIHTVTATDKDIGANGMITYSIISGNNGNKFSIDATTGKLTAKTLDRETQARYDLTISAYDHGSPVALQGSCNLTVMVEDQNDNDPVFDTGHYSAAIPEDASIDTSIIKVRATDADLGLNKRIVYSLANESQGLFRIDNKTGIIYTTGYFDREKNGIYHFDAVATDQGRYTARSQRVSVEVTINDVNDNKPIFTKYPFKEQMATLTPPGQSLLRVSATDNDIGINSEILYELLDTSNHKFRINPTTGVLTATQSLASENGKLIHLKVLAKDKGNPPQISIGLIEIRVGDFPDQTPSLSFQNTTYNITIDENLQYGKEVLQVTALRSDGRRQRIFYEFGNGNDQYAFEIDSNTGVIRVNNSANLDYESYPGPRRELVIVARTDGTPTLYGYCNLIINLLDQNDHAPRFTQQQYTANVLEGNTKGEFVVQLAAKDGDRGANARILYHIVDGNHDNAFIIEPAFSGSVKTNIVLDREIRESYKLTVIATDEGNPQMTGTATLRINVVDVNDNQPTFPPPNVISVSEGAEVGSILTSVTANDVDTYPALKYAIVQGDNTFSIDRYSGKIVLNRALDYESKKVYQVNISASDNEHLAKTTLTIKVTDINDNSPTFDEISYNRVLPEGSGVMEIGSVSAKDVDSDENGKVSYHIFEPSPGYYIDPNSGVLYVNYSALPVHQRDVQLAVIATDHGQPNRSAIASVRISTGASSEIKPFIGQDTYRITVNEDTEKGTSLLQIGGINDVLKKYNLDFHIISGNEGDAFDVTTEGALLLVNRLDREVQDSYVLGLAAMEQGKVLSYNQNKTSIMIFVTVTDANDNAPSFSLTDFELTISENVKIGHTLTQLTVNDADLYGTPNSAIIFNITSGDDEKSFYVHPSTGILTVNKSLDYDTGRTKQKLIIVACDQGSPCLCNAVYINVEILDENDNTPTFPVNEYFETIGENERVGTSVFTARATDLDRGKYGKLNYSIVPLSTNYNRNDNSWKMFQIDPVSGLVNTNAVFDYEQKNKYEFSIKASDLGGKSSTVKVRIDIESRDEFYPQFTQKTYNFGIPKSGSLPAGYIIGQATATDRDKGIDGRIVYQLSTSHSYFKINRTTGVIILKKKVESVKNLFGADKSISLVVTASSGRQGSLTNKTAVEILLDPLAVVSDITNHMNDTSVAQSSGLSDWALGLLIAFIFIIIIFAAAFLFLHMKNKRHKKGNKPGLNSEGVGTTNSYVDPSAFDTIPIRNTGPVNSANQFAPPKYDEIPPYGAHTASSNSGAATTSELSGSDQSGSSGRGSAEDGEDGEDEEIRMINEGPLQRETGIHRQTNGVDDDNLSDVSVHNTQEYLARLGIVDTGTGGGASTSSRRCSENVGNKDTMLHHGPIDSMHIFDEEGAHENDITNLIYAKLNEVTGSERASSADEASAAVERAMALGAFPSTSGDNNAVPTAGPSMTGSLSSIVHSEEELTGSYNWDYLLDWGPQYQPLAHVFSEIARLKDDAVSLQSGNSGASSAKSKGTSILGGKSVPPPLLTTVAPRSCPAPSLSCRQPQHLLPRSPISHDVAGGFSAAAAMSPSFSPSLSPLATRSPSMSPLVGPGLPPAAANRKPPHSTMRM